MNSFLTRLVQRGAGLPTALASTRRTSVAADGPPSPGSPRDSSDRAPDAGPRLEASDANPQERPVQSASLVPRIRAVATQEIRHAVPDTRSEDVSRSDDLRVRMPSPATRTSAVTSSPDRARPPVGEGVEVESSTSGRVSSDPDVHRPEDAGTRGVSRAMSQPFAGRETTAPSIGDSLAVRAPTTPEGGRDLQAASPGVVKEVKQRTDATDPTTPETNRKESSQPTRVPVTEPASIVRLPYSPLPHSESEAEGEHVEVHIGRIEVKVAPPPVQRPSSPRRSTGFDRYRSVRRYADRNWY